MAADLDQGRGLVSLGTTSKRELDLSRLRQDLVGLWRDEGHGVVKACHATLVLSVSLPEAAEELEADLVRERPSRILRLSQADRLGQGEMEAWASGSCFRGPEGGSLICCETGHLVAGRRADARIASVVRSLTVGGMPLELLILDRSPLSLGWVSRLGREADRILFRSGSLRLDLCPPLWELCRPGGEAPRYHDLTWAELQGWRWALAAPFDRIDAGSLGRLRRVTLTSGGPQARSPEAVVLAGWLGSRLGWKNPTKVSREEWSLETPGRAHVSLRLAGTQPHAGGEGISKVTFEVEGEDPHWSWSIDSGARTWSLRGFPGGAQPRRLRAVPESRSETVLRVLRDARPDPVAPPALDLARRLVESGRE